MKKLLLTAAIAIGMASTAHAGSIASTIDFTKDFNSWEDQSGEFAISGFNPDGSPIIITTGNLEIGDMFVGLLDIENSDGTPVGGGTANNELTALFITEITGITNIDIISGKADFTFGAASATAWSNITGGLIDVTSIDGMGMDVSGGVMALLFEDSKKNVDFTSIPGGLATTLDGNLRAAIGLDNSGNTGWDANAPVDITDFTGAFAGTPLGSFRFNVNALYENFGFDFERTLPSQFGNGYTDFRVANGTVSAPEQGFGFPVQDNATIFFSAIPEPAGLGLMGLGLLGVSLLARRRRS